MRSLISLPQLLGPLLIVHLVVAVIFKARWGVFGLTFTLGALELDSMIHLYCLLCATNHIMGEAIARHTSNDLVLAGHVELIEHFIKLLLHLENLSLELLNA
jgi:hypothetical protein